jgi:uncharacterized membrane protein
VKHAFFAVIAAMTAFVVWHNERFLLNAAAPEWAHYGPIRWYLIPHGVAGTLALGLGAAQFSTRLRRNHPAVHRLSGKLYIAGAFVAGPVAIVMAFVNSPWFLVPFTLVQAGAWMLFTGVAFACIRRGHVAAHREWMVRSYGIVLIFLEGRVLMAIPALGRGGMDSVVLVNWGCLALTLIVSECVLRWRQIVPARGVVRDPAPV